MKTLGGKYWDCVKSETCLFVYWNVFFDAKSKIKIARFLMQCLENSFESSFAFDMETSYWFCRGQQMTGYQMKLNTGLKCVNAF